MTKVLLISNKADITTDLIVQKLHERTIPFYRFNTEELTRSIEVSLDINSSLYSLYDRNISRNIDLTEFTAVYFRRPELPRQRDDLTYAENNFVRNEIAFVLEGIYKVLKKAYWISDIQAIREAENKIYQLQIATELGFKIPNSLITNSYNAAKKFHSLYEQSIIKPIKSGAIGAGSDEKLIFTSRMESFPEDRGQIESCPQFFQNEIIKKADLRITVVGLKEFSAMIHSQDNSETITDWRKGETILNHSRYSLPSDMLEKCITLIRTLKLRFGAIDMILDTNDDHYFLEINPNGQWGWIEKQLKYDISGELVNLLCNETF